MTTFEIRPEAKKQVEDFCERRNKEAESLLAVTFPRRIAELDDFLKEGVLNVQDLASLQGELDIPIPDPAKEELKKEKKKKKQEEKGEKEEKKKDKDEEDEGPPCGPISSNPHIQSLLLRLKPQIQSVKEAVSSVSLWVQFQIPQIEDGNNFGVAVQEKVFELMTATRTKIEGFQTQISKYFSERGDAVAKASKQPHVGDYRQLVHELDQNQYSEIRFMVLEIRNIYAVLYDIICKNFNKIKKPKGDSKALIY
ncbi:proteasome activator complex subunit 1-like [Acipenser ruthenus]|uniref:proteasome activator complex subunit 1-like n=1 Tax=Acipenser ruthenus TaxID=7906 RepID=UPI00145BDF43|nr:proteasome activator complex subunit 1-like [Acipenser ruthenus]